jgi:hypothetical protein
MQSAIFPRSVVFIGAQKPTFLIVSFGAESDYYTFQEGMLETQKLRQQARHTTPRLRNSKTHTTRKENVTPQKAAIRPTHMSIKNKAITADTPARTASLES